MQLLFMKHWLSDNTTRAICWTLIHSLWQGLILAALAGLLVLLTRKHTAAFRYNILAVLFFVFMGVVAFTFLQELSTPAATDAIVQLAPVQPEQQVVSQLSLPQGPAIEAYQEGYITRFTGYFNQHASLLVTIWFLIFLARAVKLLSGLVYIQRIKHHKVQAPAAAWTHRMQELAGILGIKIPVQLLESGLVKVPVVAGLLKPVILVPIGLMANLPAEQVEAILLHELAHIRRRDFMVNLAQSFAEILFFFNPAVLWVSSLLREEREHCCDDMAIAVTQSKTGYIHALVSFQEYQLENTSPYAMAFPGKKNQLLNRVKRILDNSHKTLNMAEKSFLVLCLSLIGLLSVVLAQPDPKREAEKTAQKEPWPLPEKAGQGQPAEKDRSLSADENKDEGRDQSRDRSGNETTTNGDTDNEVSFSERFNNPDEVSEGTTLSFDETQAGKPLHVHLLKRNNRLYQVDTRYNTVVRLKVNGKAVLQEGTPVYASKLKEYQPLISYLLAQYQKTQLPVYQPYEADRPVAPVIKDTMPVLRKGNSVLTGTITHDLDGKQYKITIDKNLATGLMIDGEKVPDEKLLEYRELIGNIFRQMQADAEQAYHIRAKEAEANSQRLAAENEVLAANQLALQQQQGRLNMLHTKPIRLDTQGKLQLRDKIELKKQERTVLDDIIDDLVSAGIITETNPLSFRINQREMVVNGVQQPEALKRQFHDKYVKKPSNTYSYSRNGGTTTSTVVTDR